MKAHGALTRICVLATVTAASLAMSGVASAGDDPAGDGSGVGDADLARYLFVPVFDILDCTNQGFIEAGEIDEHFPVLFNPISGGQTRRLSRDAFVSSDDPDEAALQASLFDRMDVNADGSLSAREYRDGMQRLLSRMDADGDAEITMQELTAGRAPAAE